MPIISRQTPSLLSNSSDKYYTPSSSRSTTKGSSFSYSSSLTSSGNSPSSSLSSSSSLYRSSRLSSDYYRSPLLSNDSHSSGSLITRKLNRYQSPSSYSSNYTSYQSSLSSPSSYPISGTRSYSTVRDQNNSVSSSSLTGGSSNTVALGGSRTYRGSLKSYTPTHYDANDLGRYGVSISIIFIKFYKNIIISKSTPYFST